MKTFSIILTAAITAILFAAGCVNEEPAYKNEPGTTPAPEDGTGYLFESYDAGAMLDVIGQATGLYRGDRKGFDTVRQRGMTEDFSWTRSADSYRHIYENL